MKAKQTMETPESDLDDEDFLRAHYESQHHRGRLESPTVSFSLLNRTCGDCVILDLQLEDSQITQAKFEAQGCVISQAAASILCELITGMEIASLKEFDAPAMLQAIRIPLSPRRKRCGLLAWEALQSMLTELNHQVKGDKDE
ncbi:iron-sulfur cluster assembly scaffold protein [Gimesia fumaroli]|uniref:iron-sulfur cluster assembly scaffold protein n=1 Tax=Gimesia fumaroli TaxID=2527976 RepID=UPI0018D93E79|nr:iron-sulfur cluster assembly scaffold protein [Gimesia fumaroli]